MGCTASLPSSPRLGGRLSSRTRPAERSGRSLGGASSHAGTSFQDNSSQQLLDDVASLEPKLASSLATLRGFEPDILSEATETPTAILSWLVVQPVLKTVGGEPHLLAALLLKLARIVRKEGQYVEQDKLYTLQFLYSQMQLGGCLWRLVASNPSLIVAVCISAHAFDLPRLRQRLRRRWQNAAGSAARLSNQRRRSVSDPGIGTRRLSLTAAHCIALRRYLSTNPYFMSLPSVTCTSLLQAIGEISEVADPNFTRRMLLSNEAVLKLADKPDIHLLQATLAVASNSHLFRSFSVHQAWCTQRLHVMEQWERDGLANSFGRPGTISAFAAPDVNTARFARCQAWAIDSVLLPVIDMWARLAGSDHAAGLSLAASNTSRTYAIMALADSGASSQSASTALLAERTSSEPPSTSTRRVLVQSKTFNTVQDMRDMPDTTTHSSPLSPKNPVHTAAKLPNDTEGLACVCKMYNVNPDWLLSAEFPVVL